MEYMPFGDLGKYIPTGEIKERDAKQIARDMIEALIIIHEEGFTHRDIKPQVRWTIFTVAIELLTILPNLTVLERLCDAKGTNVVGETWRFWHNQADRQ